MATLRFGIQDFSVYLQVDDCCVALEVIENDDKGKSKKFSRHGCKKALTKETTMDITCTSEVQKYLVMVTDTA